MELGSGKEGKTGYNRREKAVEAASEEGRGFRSSNRRAGERGSGTGRERERKLQWVVGERKQRNGIFHHQVSL